jgi:hypothetical protein
MKKFLWLIFLPVLIFSCGKEHGDPSIKLAEEAGFISKDTILKVNDSIKVKLEAEWNGFDLLNLFEVRMNDEKVGTSSLNNEGAVFTLTLTKGTLETEIWDFLISDKRGNSDKVSLVITKDPNSIYGEIIQITPIVLGFQKSLSKPGLISFSTNQTFNLDQAYVNQGKIDLLGYYDNQTEATLASPGSDIPEATFSGSRNPLLWTTRNTTKFLKINYTEAQFESVVNDVPILNLWSDSQAVTKATHIAKGDVFLFRLESGRKGMLLIRKVNAGEDGDIEFSVRVQD